MCETLVGALGLGVAQECSELAREEGVGQEHEELLGEFECVWELPHQLPHDVEPLHEDGRAFLVVVFS